MSEKRSVKLAFWMSENGDRLMLDFPEVGSVDQFQIMLEFSEGDVADDSRIDAIIDASLVAMRTACRTAIKKKAVTD